jgi:hypothetical protein
MPATITEAQTVRIVFEEFLERIAGATELIDVNIAAGIALQELDDVE